ncbi:MAG: C1 family peptidase [Melioribacteraceae bacterium]|nr:MAG: C1 family peptidase [Melioribacteraceae bacterium]
MFKKLLVTVLFVSFVLVINAQDKGVYVESSGKYWKQIEESIKKYEAKDKSKKVFQVDLEGMNIPTSTDQFNTYWHQAPISQGNTGTCWSFSTTSYFESEVYRIHKKEVKLSELYTVYWEYVEKAKEFVRTRGESLFAEGSEANAVNRIWKQYGIVPGDLFTGLKEGQEFHNHSHLYKEMNSYLETVKANNAWNENVVLETIKSILDYHLGTPPEKFLLDGKEYTPQTFLSDYLKLNLDDYYDILSYLQQPFWEQVEYEVPDNWWHSKEYWNIPLDDYMKLFKSAIRNGYSICIGGDVSEPGKVASKDVFLVPDFDIPSEYINDYARQFRFDNETTTDDHGVHVVGWMELNGEGWYLIKDSGSSARDGNNKGYYFFSEDYIKLKIMDFMVHKDALGELAEKLK